MRARCKYCRITIRVKKRGSKGAVKCCKWCAKAQFTDEIVFNWVGDVHYIGHKGRLPRRFTWGFF